MSQTLSITQNTVMDTINQRRSIGNLTAPAPTRDEVNAALTCALSAPDHKSLTPWRFCVITQGGLSKLGEALAQAAQALDPSISQDALDRILAMPHRAPMIVVAISTPKMHDKVPVFEQILSTGAACQNLILAFESMGYKSVWRTGNFCNMSSVRDFFALGEADRVCGMVYVGTSEVESFAKPKSVDQFTTFITQ